MAVPENQTLRLLRDIRDAVRKVDQKVDQKVDGLRERMEQKFGEVTKRFDSLQQAVIGEGVLGRYAAAEVEERLTALEKRLSKLETR